MIVRPEQPSDIPAIRDLVGAVMGDQEARLIDALRADGDATLSLVAEDEQRIVGHILFSPIAAPFFALALAPLCVAADRQRRGIGKALVRAGLERARTDGWQAVFVLGDPDYYGRFGFDASAAAGFETPYAGPYLMALPLGTALSVNTGTLRYAPAFAKLG